MAFVVGNAGDPTAGDRLMAARLREQGLEVRLVDHGQPAQALTGASLILVSASCISTNIGALFRDTPVPVVSLEAFILDDMGFVGPEKSVDLDEDQGTEVTVTNPGHELGAGLTGTFPVATATANLAWGRPAPGAVVIATIPGNAAKVAVHAYDRMGAMIGLQAPARRVAFFATDVLAETLTAEGWRLFDAAIAWALR